MDLSCKIELFLEAAGLPNLDSTSRTDSFAVVDVRDATGAWRQVGQTEVVRDSLAPRFATQFIVDFRFEEVQPLRVTLWDEDPDSPEYIGEVELPLGRVMGSRGSSLAAPLERKQGRPLSAARMRTAVLVLRGAEVRGGGSDLLRFQFRAEKLDKKDFGFWASSDPFYVLNRVRPDGSRMKVFESEHIMRSLNPVWAPQSLPLQLLCGSGDMSVPIVVEVFDWDSDGTHDFIGECSLSARQLLEAAAAGAQFALVDPKKAGKKGYVSSGQLMLAAPAALVHQPTFVEYLQGGLQMNLIVAVDYTGSNGDPRLPTSLHFMNPTAPNQYVQAIAATSAVLLEYDADKRVPLFGFGAQIDGSREASHCFAVNMREADPEVAGVDGVIAAYAASFSRLVLSGPTYFAPLIRRAAEAAAAGGGQADQRYTVLLLLTDGAVMDVDETVRAIVDASALPLSIVIVGVGRADFSTMEFLDADKGALSCAGRKALRDIVQFVPYRKCAAYGAGAGSQLAKEVLAEVPAQVVAAMALRGIVPNAPRAAQAAPLYAPAAPSLAGAGYAAGAGGSSAYGSKVASL